MIIHPSAVIVNKSMFAQDVDIRALVYVADKVKIGKNVVIHEQAHITEGAIIEDDVYFGPMAMMINTRHISHGRQNMLSERKPAIVKRGARIAAKALIMPDVTIGEQCLIGAGSVVTKNTEPFGIYYGVPARFMGWIPENERL